MPVKQYPHPEKQAKSVVAEAIRRRFRHNENLCDVSVSAMESVVDEAMTALSTVVFDTHLKEPE